MAPTKTVSDVNNLPVWDQASDDDLCVMTSDEVARLLGFCKHTMIRLRQQPDCGGLPYIQLSAARVRY